MKIGQKVLTYTPVQKLEMFLEVVLDRAKAVSSKRITVRLDPALISAFGLPGCAEQSSIAQMLNVATEQDVADLQAALGEIFDSYSQAKRHDFIHRVLDMDLSPLSASKHAEESERGYMECRRSRDGGKLVKVRAAASQEIVWETIITGRMVGVCTSCKKRTTPWRVRSACRERKPTPSAQHRLTDLRMDSGWGSEPIITWLVVRGYHVTGLI